MFKKIFLKQFTIATKDKCSSDVLSFMKSLSEKFDVLKEEVGNLTLARKLHLTATWIPQVMNRVVIHLQTLLGLRAGRLGETGKSKRGIDALGAELSMTK